MTADDFANKLRLLTPSHESLKREGIVKVAEFQSMFDCVARPVQAVYKDPVLDLVHRYDCSKIQIGMVRFLGGPEDNGTNWRVADDEADPLVVDKATGELYVVELGVPTFVISACAKDGSRFLAAMLGIAEAVARLSDLGYPEDVEFRRTLASPSVESAGGEKYQTFYRYLLNCV